MDGGADDPALVRAVAEAICAAFADYDREFRAITRRAERRFRERGWQLGARDAVERIELYDRRVEKCLADLIGLMGRRIADEVAWGASRDEYARLIAERADREFYQTFFNSLTRKVFRTVGVNDRVEFASLDAGSAPVEAAVAVLDQPAGSDLAGAMARVLHGLPWAALVADHGAAAGVVAAEIGAFVGRRGLMGGVTRLEVLEPVFYRATRAFVVGRVSGPSWTLPMVIAFRHEGDGIEVDAVMLSDYEVRPLFGFSRSYFHVDLASVGPTVQFLRTIMPGKATDELYTVLGRARQGKTERYRRLFRHLQLATDLFARAEGERGMVMIVFTLASLDIVFKVIRDRFDYPKSATRDEVMEKYRFVFRHDRVGRLVDAQEFRRLRFPKARFEPDLLEELLAQASQTCRVDGDDLIVEHCYLERRMKPLNLYLREADGPAARRAIRDYGQAIRDLALSNVFPGDLLLKNFGVSRHGRVIFYDYDELTLVTSCNFRDIPPERDEEDALRGEPWFYIGPADVFPAQWLDFLGLTPPLREEFVRHHAEVLTAAYWRRIKALHDAEALMEIVPYTARSATTAVPA